MGYPVMFYINENNKNSLKGIVNRSLLINQLLEDHFKNTIPKTRIDIEKELKIEEAKLEAIEKIEAIENGHI